MNQDFLLKTETGINAAQSAQNQVAVISEGSDKNQLFSEELGKQIDQRDSFLKTTEQGELSAGKIKNTNATAHQKPEKQISENGKSLPTDSEVVDIFSEQLLSDVDASPALKQELKQAIEQFVETFLNEGESEHGFEDGLAALITQIVNATSGQKVTEGGQAQVIKKGVNTGETTAPPLTAATQETIKNRLRGIAGSNTEAIGSTAKVMSAVVQTTEKAAEFKSTQTESGLKTINIASPISGERLEKTTGQQSALSNQLVTAEKVSEQTGQVERTQTVLQQIKEAILKDVNDASSQKTDKIIPDKTSTVNKVQASPNEYGQQGAPKEVSSSSVLTQLRADIMQALPIKPLASASTLESKTGGNSPRLNVKSEMINSEEKRTERLLQLIDLIKPAKEDTSARPINIDKAAPTVLTSVSTPASSPLTKSEGPTLDIQPALQSKAWNRVLSSRVVWMANEGIQQAALRLNPANLGPVEVRLQIQNEQASVSFIAHNAATREALEQALPRLRESFVENGLELTDADVSDQASQEASEDGTQSNNKKDNQGNDVTVIKGNETSSEQAIADVKPENELGVNVYA